MESKKDWGDIKQHSISTQKSLPINPAKPKARDLTKAFKQIRLLRDHLVDRKKVTKVVEKVAIF